MPLDFTHFLRLGTHAEADTFRRAARSFDALVLNANLVEASPAACAALVYQLNKPFIIDPYSYAFAVPHQYLLSRGKSKTSKGDLRPKRSFLGLGQIYFGSASDFVGKRSLQPSEVAPEELARRVLDYQSNRLRQAVGDPSETHIASSERLSPLFRIAPYFPLMDGLDWLSANVRCVAAAVQVDSEAGAVVAVESAVLTEHCARLVDAYAETGVKRILLWVDNFDEDRANRDMLDLYSDVIRAFHSRGVQVLNLFGGFFSCIAQSIGLGGFVHGLGYGENRGIIPVLGGGQPPPRYYARPLHTSMSVIDAATIFAPLSAERYLRNVCDCVICERLVNEGGVSNLFSTFAETDEKGRFTPRAYAHTRFHFLLSRKTEVDGFLRLTPSEKIQYLDGDERLLIDLDSRHVASHISLWKNYLG